MKAIPAIDLREGACVQLVGGSYEDERVRLPDPVAQAVRFRDAGFTHLHVVDLDAATGRGSNRAVVLDLLRVPGLAVQIGGGIRTKEDADALLEGGADAIVVGTRALEDRPFLEDLARAHPQRVVIALDVRGREVVTRGWSAGSGREVEGVLDDVAALPLRGALVTAVHVEGSLAGVDEALYRDLVQRSTLPIIASGGVGAMRDLELLAAAGCAAVVIGMAIYSGAVDVDVVARKYGVS
ncbi:MAG TPA: 1-(5-phosphoribosyl)-5-[(5-phosphoribosylamino)methylideneamino] imidazole-4-carboxamide isomerase [Polyangiaceae bacterium]|jgi:phosphoribosylformimino-5-aminoimidazole carboxamide ribotide isomerase|nr:1-(5-phosphoribosyl)-5-[(5-phosphoribosylamino)methylideneamino] imidazole-4-carboxamide isomerase [Polyangiaceae bacterium]